MNISFKRDDQLKYKPDILKGLIAYNKTFAGDALSETINVYILDGDNLVGGCHTELEWNWVYIEALFYLNQDILIAMMNELYKLFKRKSEGIITESHISNRIEDFKLIGYESLGTLENKPLGYVSHTLVNKKMDHISINHKYELKIAHKKHEIYSKLVDEQVKTYNEKLKIDDSKTKIQYVAFDQKKVVGGVYGYLIKDYLHTSILWVDEAYRGNNIATKLMNYIEDEAQNKGYNQFYLETCTFQAKDFYEKRGYKVKMIKNNCPKGYDDYTMVKRI